jgi:hypothetical protein
MWKRGGYSFLEIQRPLDLKGSCPEGFKTCNPESSPEKGYAHRNTTYALLMK